MDDKKLPWRAFGINVRDRDNFIVAMCVNPEQADAIVKAVNVVYDRPPLDNSQVSFDFAAPSEFTGQTRGFTTEPVRAGRDTIRVIGMPEPSIPKIHIGYDLGVEFKPARHHYLFDQHAAIDTFETWQTMAAARGMQMLDRYGMKHVMLMHTTLPGGYDAFVKFVDVKVQHVHC